MYLKKNDSYIFLVIQNRYWFINFHSIKTDHQFFLADQNGIINHFSSWLARVFASVIGLGMGAGESAG